MEQTCLYRTKETLSPNRQKIDVLIIRNLVPKRKFRISRFFSYFLDDNISKIRSFLRTFFPWDSKGKNINSYNKKTILFTGNNWLVRLV